MPVEYLNAIVARKKNELKQMKRKKSFKEALQEEKLTVIGEIKRRSPSKGDLNAALDPVLLAEQYVKGGASVISVLTDAAGFGGSLRDLQLIAQQNLDVPLLRKDFIVDLYQLEESVKAGADVVLLIVAALQEQTGEFLKLATAMGLEALVEVNTKEELQIALDAGAELIAVNNRNLHTFEVDLQTAFNLAPLIPKKALKVAASGIQTPAEARAFHRAGFHGVLIGEALVKTKNPAALIVEMVQ